MRLTPAERDSYQRDGYVVRREGGCRGGSCRLGCLLWRVAAASLVAECFGPPATRGSVVVSAGRKAAAEGVGVASRTCRTVTLSLLLLASACSQDQRTAPQVVARPALSCRQTAATALPQPDGTTLFFVRCTIVGAGGDDDAAVRRAASELFNQVRPDAEAKGYGDVVVSAGRGDQGALNVAFKRAANGGWMMVAQ